MLDNQAPKPTGRDHDPTSVKRMLLSGLILSPLYFSLPLLERKALLERLRLGFSR
ncbi:MAG: hypothetical protein KKB20_12465 [Proteobacteria bacterium]|nr:hypothetical protein [Pseudomonadota bacterium]